jgi:hypothetical protein
MAGSASLNPVRLAKIGAAPDTYTRRWNNISVRKALSPMFEELPPSGESLIFFGASDTWWSFL